MVGDAAVVPGVAVAGPGTGWSIVASPNGARFGDNTLMEVSAGPAASAWAVGYAGGAGTFRTMVQRWNGSRWAVLPSPNVSPLDNVLAGVDTVSADDAWAVGYAARVTPRGAAPHARALIERFNGRRWAAAPAPQVPGSSSLADVLALTPHLAWAVGSYSPRPGVNRTLVERWNGRAWTVTSSPGPRPSSELLGIAGTPQHLWAVGTALTDTLILRH